MIKYWRWGDEEIKLKVRPTRHNEALVFTVSSHVDFDNFETWSRWVEPAPVIRIGDHDDCTCEDCT